MFRTNCLVCGSKNLEEIVNLGMHSFADTFVPQDRLSEPDMAYPLVCDLCSECGQIQARSVTRPEDRYCTHDYSYTSSNSGFSREHWTKYAQEVSQKVGLQEGDFVLEIGSNDGFLSERFLKAGQIVLGVDPSRYMADLARERGVETFVGLFDGSAAEKIMRKHGKPKLIVANNVFNHSNDPLDFARGVAAMLDEDGTFVFELPCWCIGVRDGHVDQIYHEHVSYFTARSSKALLERAGLKINGIGVVDYHGGSLRVFAKHAERVQGPCEEETALIDEERRDRTFDVGTYRDLMHKVHDQRDRFLQKVYEIKEQGGHIVCVGAAAKGNTLLTFYNLGNRVIDYVTDSSPHKQGKYTPLTRIPIVSDDIFRRYDSVHALILSWNLTDRLKTILLPINPNIKFISP